MKNCQENAVKLSLPAASSNAEEILDVKRRSTSGLPKVLPSGPSLLTPAASRKASNRAVSPSWIWDMSKAEELAGSPLRRNLDDTSSNWSSSNDSTCDKINNYILKTWPLDFKLTSDISPSLSEVSAIYFARFPRWTAAFLLRSLARLDGLEKRLLDFLLLKFIL